MISSDDKKFIFVMTFYTVCVLLLAGLLCFNLWNIRQQGRIVHKQNEQKNPLRSIKVQIEDMSSSDTCLDGNMLPLFAYPDKYDGQWVRVQGYMNYQFESHSLRPYRECVGSSYLSIYSHDMDVSSRPNGQHPLHGRYVTIEGVFEKRTNYNTRGSHSGYLKVHKVEAYPPAAPVAEEKSQSDY